MKNSHYLVLILLILVIGCKEENKQQVFNLKSGPWRATLSVQDQKQLPFLFEVLEDETIKIFNADETIDLDKVKIIKDSVFIHFPVFEGYIAAKFIDSVRLEGAFVKDGLGRTVPFVANYGLQDRFKIEMEPLYNITGSWETIFSKNSDKDRYIAKGIFKQNGNVVTGTFRTTTGDYRFLEGVINSDKLQLSTFDGAHAFLFTGIVSDSLIEGKFYSGNHWKEPFIAKRNDTYELPDEESLTYIKEGYDTFDFKFPNSKGDSISLTDARFKNKVKIIQIMGTWCPNCLDESKYLSQFYKKNKQKDLEIIALAFEYAKTKDKAVKAITKFKKSVGVDYPVLIAQYGTSDKDKAQEKLPMLNQVLSYPTTIFIDKQGEVRKIHTGFNGPATGKKYEEFKVNFESFVETLLKE